MPHDEKPKRGARVTEDCFAALVRAFKASPRFQGYSESTQATWGRELDHASTPSTLGALSLHKIRPSLVQGYFDGIAHLPGKQAVALSALRQLEKWAIVRELLPRQITLGVETEEGDDDGHIPWTAEQVAIAEQHARADLARAVTLGANTGQRGSDLIRMSPSDVETFNGRDGVNVRQKKTRKLIWVPITQDLAAAMASWERRPGPFLLRPNGKPWARKKLTDAWQHERDTNKALAPHRELGLVLHGLRAFACVRLLRAGANTRQISDMIGMSEEMVKRYTRFSEQKENASAAVYHLDREARERVENKT
jgi:integrase